MNITEVLDELEIEYQQANQSPHVTIGWIGLICPWCGIGTGKYGLGISLERGSVTCWKCGPHSLVSALMECSGQPFSRVKELIDLSETEPIIPERPRGRLKLPTGIGPMLPAHRRYLIGRGFNPGILERLWGLQGIGMAARLQWRIFIPILAGGKTVSWTTRSVSDSVKPKYVGASPEEESARAKSLLFGADYIRHKCIVVEGPMDAMRLGPGAVATLGVGWTAAQLRRLAKIPERTVAFDNEPEAQMRAEQLCLALRAFPGKTNRALIDAADPGSASDAEVKLLRRSFLE